MNRRELGPREFARVTAGKGLVATGRVREASPVLADGVERFIFADVFSRSGLGAREREMLTVAVLAAIGGADNQLGVHVPAALESGADPEEMLQLCEQIAPYAGFPRALNALRAVRAALEERGEALPAPAVEVDLGDTGTLVTDSGEGPEGLLLLHAPELDRRVWRDVVAALPAGTRAVAPDLRGAGAAAAAPAATSLDGLVADLAAVADALSLERCRVVALGGAAPLAAAFARARTPRVRDVVLVGPVPPGTVGGDAAHGRPPAAADLARWMSAVHLAEGGWGVRYARDRVHRTDPAGWAALVHVLASGDPTAIPVPVRVLVGERDAVCDAEAAALAWIGAALAHVPGAAHLVPLEAPEALAGALAG